jgi:hypothetical protein
MRRLAIFCFLLVALCFHADTAGGSTPITTHRSSALRRLVSGLPIIQQTHSLQQSTHNAR